MRNRHLHLTRRGLGVLVTGVGATAGGVVLGVVTLVQLGVLLLLALALSLVLLLGSAQRHRRGGLRVARDVRPHPVTAGAEAAVTVTLTARPSISVARLEVTERAARELSGGSGLRARVSRRRSDLTLTYPLAPHVRGRWAVGPLQVHQHDVFGLLRRSGTVGEAFRVAVRPRTTPLRVTTSAMASDADRAATGTRTPAADDALLRGYVTGDDLRRVHWPSSARRGELLVRQDEASGRRPASVLLDLAQDGPTTEWSIRLAASVALALARTGHHVRLLGGDTPGGHHRPDVGHTAADAILDGTVDLRVPQDETERHAWFRTALDTMHADAGGTELVLAVVGALPDTTLTALAATGETTRGRAFVRRTETSRTTSTTTSAPPTGDGTSGTTTGEPAAPARRAGADAGAPEVADAERTAARLRRAGWTVCLVDPGEDLAACWERLLAADDRLLVAP